jgi:exodeoxyribonuclease V alpha subunit
MQIRNNYDKIVFNGDVGTITDINISDKIIFVQFYERVVEYEQSELDELVLAYAISIHKSQGSEYPAVIIPIFMQHFTLLQRNLLYTAITRAKKLCILIGQPRAIGMAVKNNKSLERITFLTQFLVNNLEAR